ncbi:peptidase [uncultured Dokdonia sp.]|uniref:peptidase n=1 Tax=uncultured Dokdonia sp. TaxID=575653 RepID=UPI0026388D7D|nr:peptidase [uncultured Dokdonia sp.]
MFIPEVKSQKDEDICILIRVENHSHNYICECGEAKSLTVKECQNTKAIFISHTHIDHFVNFDTILRHQIGGNQRVIICGPTDITKQVQSRIQSYRWNLITKDAITYEIREIQSNGTIKRAELKPPLWEITPIEDMAGSSVFENDLFEVSYTILDHKTDTIAYLFKGKDTTKIDLQKGDFKGGKWVRDLKTAFETNDPTCEIIIEDTIYKAADLFHLINVKKGQKLGVIMDHAASVANHKNILETFTNADQVFIESFYKVEDKEGAMANYHSYSSESGRIMRACNVQDATPVHFSRKYNETDINELLQEFESAYRG